MVHSRAELANIGKADAEFQQIRKFMRLVPARRDAYFVDRTPKAIAAMRVVMAEVGGSLARGGADEDEAQIFLEQVRKPFQLVRALFVSALQYPPVRFQRWMPGRSLVPSRHPADLIQRQIGGRVNSLDLWSALYPVGKIRWSFDLDDDISFHRYYRRIFAQPRSGRAQHLFETACAWICIQSQQPLHALYCGWRR